MREFKEMMWKETGNNWWYSEILNYEKDSVIYELPHSTGLLEHYFRVQGTLVRVNMGISEKVFEMINLNQSDSLSI